MKKHDLRQKLNTLQTKGNELYTEYLVLERAYENLAREHSFRTFAMSTETTKQMVMDKFKDIARKELTNERRATN